MKILLLSFDPNTLKYLDSIAVVKFFNNMNDLIDALSMKENFDFLIIDENQIELENQLFYIQDYIRNNDMKIIILCQLENMKKYINIKYINDIIIKPFSKEFLANKLYFWKNKKYEALGYNNNLLLGLLQEINRGLEKINFVHSNEVSFNVKKTRWLVDICELLGADKIISSKVFHLLIDNTIDLLSLMGCKVNFSRTSFLFSELCEIDKKNVLIILLLLMRCQSLEENIDITIESIDNIIRISSSNNIEVNLQIAVLLKEFLISIEKKFISNITNEKTIYYLEYKKTS